MKKQIRVKKCPVKMKIDKSVDHGAIIADRLASLAENLIKEHNVDSGYIPYMFMAIGMGVMTTKIGTDKARQAVITVARANGIML
jgi:hypothetical protein